MGAEPGAEGLCKVVHLGAVAREDGAVDDEGGGPERIEVLALVLVDEVLLLGLAADMIRRAGLLGDERVRLGVFVRAHGGREDWDGGDAEWKVLMGGEVGVAERGSGCLEEKRSVL